MASERKKIQKIKKLVEELLARNQPPDVCQECPNCGGQLELSFEAYYRKDWMLGVRVSCEQCMIDLAMDRGAPIPEWAKPISDDALITMDK